MTPWTTEHIAPQSTTTTTMKKGNTLMHHLAAALHTLGLTLTETATTKRSRRKEEGSVTIENVLWAVAVIAIVGIVVVAITAYVTREAAKIT